MRDTGKTRIGMLAGVLVAATAGVAGAQDPLPMGSPAGGTARSDAPAVYAVTAATAGVLSVAVDGTGDLMITIADTDGQVLPDGSTDRDLQGSLGRELLSVTITEPGDYVVGVTVLSGGSSTFEIAGSFLSFPALEAPADPDGRPSRAQAVDVGAPHDDRLDSNAGDDRDWFVFTAGEAGTLVVLTRSVSDEDVDLVVAAFREGEYTDAIDESDQDQQDNTTNETVTVTVSAGERLYVRVTGAFGSVQGPYRISSSVVRQPR